MHRLLFEETLLKTTTLQHDQLCVTELLLINDIEHSSISSNGKFTDPVITKINPSTSNIWKNSHQCTWLLLHLKMFTKCASLLTSYRPLKLAMIFHARLNHTLHF